MNKLLLLLLGAFSLFALGGCFPTENTEFLGEQTGKGWRVWIKTSPCAGGRADWLTVAQNNPTGGGNIFDSIDLLDSSATCRQAAPNGCTFQQANAEKEQFKNSERFKDYCCQDYSVWQNTRTGELAAVKGEGATAGDGWQFEDGPMCCEEAEEITGKKGLCGGTKTGGTTTGGGKESSTEIDLSGDWAAIVDTSYGKFDYSMTLKRDAAGKWTGTHTSTRNGQSPTTDAVTIESTGGGKMTFTLRPGKPNVQSFEGSYTKDRITMDGYGGQLLFTRR